jgi:hypothetical protein
MKTLDEFHRLDADLPGLAGITILFRTQKALFSSALREGLVPCDEVKVGNIDTIVAAIDEAERHGATLPIAARLYRHLKARLDARAEEIRSEGGRFVEADGRRFAIEPIVVVARNVQTNELVPAPDSQNRRGPPASVAENVLSVLVAAHLLATTGKPCFSMTGRFIAHVVGLLATAGEASDAVRSYEKRAREHWRNESLRPLISYLADLAMLLVKFD